jgi:hypothetical protein
MHACPSNKRLQPMGRVIIVSKEKTGSRKIRSNNFMGEASFLTNYEIRNCLCSWWSSVGVVGIWTLLRQQTVISLPVRKWVEQWKSCTCKGSQNGSTEVWMSGDMFQSETKQCLWLFNVLFIHWYLFELVSDQVLGTGESKSLLEANSKKLGCAPAYGLIATSTVRPQGTGATNLIWFGFPF